VEIKNIVVPFKLIEIKEESIAGQEFFTFKGYASTFNNVDLVEDIIEKGAFLDSLSKRKPKLLWQHKMSEPLGVFSDIHEDEKGLFVQGRLPKADSMVSGRVIPQMKAGSIDSMSIGFSTVDAEFLEIDGMNIRRIKKVDLWEISLVTLPANPAAKITNMKTITDVSKFLKAEGFSKSEADHIVHVIKEHVKACNESKHNTKAPCNEDEVQSGKILEMLNNLKKEITNG